MNAACFATIAGSILLLTQPLVHAPQLRVWTAREPDK